jgi:hypothetical protein
MEDRVIRLRPLPLEFEKTKDNLIANHDPSNAPGTKKESFESYF